MPDTDLMDRTLALITAVPELHDQQELSYPLTPATLRRVEVRMEGHPEFAEIECGTAHCFAVWALILAGWRLDPTGVTALPRDGLGDGENTIDAAASVLGIRSAEAYQPARLRGLFWNGNSLAQIRTWVAYYKGEITEQERDARLEEEADA